MRRHYGKLPLFVIGVAALLLSGERWLRRAPTPEMTTVPVADAGDLEREPAPSPSPTPTPKPDPRPLREQWGILPEPIREEGQAEILIDRGKRDPDRRVPKLRV